ncbi:hypothetical protein V6257_06970 [Pseudoalteromonas issachenkonii]|uniref:Preprotein translocase subunit SecE n=1 Tax=Pseudoalteromonas issachenkonii TaxID=152297 RepID=A0ABU9GYT4_9GAMM|nr:hypothetical protein [Pseudoalteromonas sp. FUC4]
MKDALDNFKTEFNAKRFYWKNLKSNKAKVFFILLFVVVVVLKIFTTVFTFDWIVGLL